MARKNGKVNNVATSETVPVAGPLPAQETTPEAPEEIKVERDQRKPGEPLGMVKASGETFKRTLDVLGVTVEAFTTAYDAEMSAVRKAAGEKRAAAHVPSEAAIAKAKALLARAGLAA